MLISLMIAVLIPPCTADAGNPPEGLPWSLPVSPLRPSRGYGRDDFLLKRDVREIRYSDLVPTSRLIDPNHKAIQSNIIKFDSQGHIREWRSSSIRPGTHWTYNHDTQGRLIQQQLHDGDSVIATRAFEYEDGHIRSIETIETGRRSDYEWNSTNETMTGTVTTGGDGRETSRQRISFDNMGRLILTELMGPTDWHPIRVLAYGEQPTPDTERNTSANGLKQVISYSTDGFPVRVDVEESGIGGYMIEHNYKEDHAGNWVMIKSTITFPQDQQPTARRQIIQKHGLVADQSTITRNIRYEGDPPLQNPDEQSMREFLDQAMIHIQEEASKEEFKKGLQLILKNPFKKFSGQQQQLIQRFEIVYLVYRYLRNLIETTPLLPEEQRQISLDQLTAHVFPDGIPKPFMGRKIRGDNGHADGREQ